MPRATSILREKVIDEEDNISELVIVLTGDDRWVERDLKNVQGDLQTLERYGLVRLNKSRRPGRRKVVPQALFNQIALKIAI